MTDTTIPVLNQHWYGCRDSEIVLLVCTNRTCAYQQYHTHCTGKYWWFFNLLEATSFNTYHWYRYCTVLMEKQYGFRYFYLKPWETLSLCYMGSYYYLWFQTKHAVCLFCLIQSNVDVLALVYVANIWISSVIVFAHVYYITALMFVRFWRNFRNRQQIYHCAVHRWGDWSFLLVLSLIYACPWHVWCMEREYGWLWSHLIKYFSYHSCKGALLLFLLVR